MRTRERRKRHARRLGGTIALPLVAALLTTAAAPAPTTPHGARSAPGKAAATAATRSLGAVTAAARAAKKRWLRGKLSHTYERNPVTGVRSVSTVEFVAYKGKRDRSFPRVGNVYLGQVWAGRAGDPTAGTEIVTEVKLPKHTRFAIGARHKVRCYKGKADGSFRRLRGRKCPNRPERGRYGWRFVPPAGSWDVPRGRWIQVIFPLRSSKRLKGIQAAPPHCIVGAVQNLSGYALRNWDAPRRRAKCPHPDGRGPYQYVYVARRRG